jgi:hypothetical protein
MYPFIAYLMSEHWTKPVPPVSDSFMADIDASFMEQIFDITKRKWKSNIHHYGKADDLG